MDTDERRDQKEERVDGMKRNAEFAKGAEEDRGGNEEEKTTMGGSGHGRSAVESNEEGWEMGTVGNKEVDSNDGRIDRRRWNQG